MAALDWKIIFLIQTHAHTHSHTHTHSHMKNHQNTKSEKHAKLLFMKCARGWCFCECLSKIREKYLFEWYIVFLPDHSFAPSSLPHSSRNTHVLSLSLMSPILALSLSLFLLVCAMCELVCQKSCLHSDYFSCAIYYAIFTIQNWWYMFFVSFVDERERVIHVMYLERYLHRESQVHLGCFDSMSVLIPRQQQVKSSDIGKSSEVVRCRRAG